MELNAENIERAVQQFYEDAGSQQGIHQWLTASQISPEAWTFSWQLLHKDKNPAVQFFGAQCLHVKISRYWHELPPEQVAPLRSQLFEQIANFAAGPKMVLTRLCIALSAFAMHTMPEVWPDAVSGIMGTFQAANLPHLQSSQVCVILLELLTVLPEEYYSSPLRQGRKADVRQELQKSATQVLSLLSGLLVPTTPPQVQEQCLHCLSSWVQFGIHLPDLMPLIFSVFSALQNEALFDQAVETLVNIYSNQENYRYPQCIQMLLPSVLQLEPMLQKAIHEHDVDQCQGLVRVVAAAGDCSTRVLVTCTLADEEQKQLAVNVVRLVLECIAIPGHYPTDEKSSDLAFGFWYNLQDEIVAYDSDKYSALADVYVPVYLQLVNILLQKVQFPLENDYDNFNSEEKEQFRCYRQDVGDTLMYAYQLLHSELLSNLCQLLGTILEKSAAEQVRWQEVEAVLYAVTAIAENVELEENTYLPQLFSMLGSVPCTNYNLISQALYLIGSYAEWISAHPEVLRNVIPLMLQGIKDVELAQPATLSLKEVVRENQDHLMPFVTQILTASQEALQSQKLKYRDAIRLMACLGYVLSVLPLNDIMKNLDIILAPHIQQLQQIANAEPSPATKSVVLLKLNMLCWLFGTLNINWQEEMSGQEESFVKPEGPQPVLLVLQQVMPVLQAVLNTWVSDVAVVDVMCDMFKRSVRTLMDDFAPLASETSEIVITMFTTYPHAVIIDLAKQLMILFASDPGYKTTSAVLFHAICTKCQSLYETGIREHPDIAEMFMIFLAQVAKKNNKMFLEENCNILALFQAGVISMAMSEGQTVKQACSFLSELIGCSENNSRVKDVVANHGHILVDQLMRSIGGESPRAVIDSMADVFLALNKHHLDLQRHLLAEVVKQDGFPTPHATKQQKQQFAARVIKERHHKRRLKDTIQEFTLLWRGLIGTEYAAQTVSIMSS